MSYEDKAEKNFSSRFCRRERAVETVSPPIWHGEGTDCSCGKLNLISDSLARDCRQNEDEALGKSSRLMCRGHLFTSRR
jgi:hypothetical protein